MTKLVELSEPQPNETYYILEKDGYADEIKVSGIVMHRGDEWYVLVTDEAQIKKLKNLAVGAKSFADRDRDEN